jgi:hypothetical protein
MAPWVPLESSWVKYHWAGTHLRYLQGELLRIASLKPEPFEVDQQIDARETWLRVIRVPEYREAGLMIGDAVHNYRAALDHLVWDLVKLGSHPQLTEKQAQRVQFPLAKSLASLQQQRRDRMPGVDDDPWRVVRLYQPYRRDDRGRAMRSLRDLSDMDKHRFIVPAVASAKSFVGRTSFVGCVGTGVWQISSRRSLHVGSKLMRVWFTPTAHDYHVDIKSEVAVEPCLGRGVLLMPTMLAIGECVREVLTSCEAFV